ncbi:MAG: lactate utilization protein, partial [Clostridium sp.]|nr:lactate utilization protein [Clostridium sp.]
MNENIKWVNEKKIEKTINNLKKNNINGYYVKDNDELINLIKDIAKEGEVVSVGGSMSLFESKVIELLRSGRYE